MWESGTPDCAEEGLFVSVVTGDVMASRCPVFRLVNLDSSHLDKSENFFTPFGVM